MAELRISTLEAGFVLYFDTPDSRINAYALASTLVALADAAKAAARTLNSAIDVEIVVEAISSGSFRARVSALARESGLFVKQQLVTGILIGVIGNYIYDHTLAKKGEVQVIVNTDEVIVTQGDDRIIVPRIVHDATQLVAQSPTFVRSIDRMLSSVILDERVVGFGLSDNMTQSPSIILPRELLAIRDEETEPTSKFRVIEEDCDLYIVKAIMERSNRKWGFKWHGQNISAPIKDQTFYDKFARHDFTIAPGDEFQARIALHQRRDDISGIYSNVSYEVVQVYRHISRPKTQPLELPSY